MTATAYTTVGSTRTAYLTPQDYLDHGQGVDLSRLLPKGNAAAQQAALATRIAGASSWIDGFCNQVLAATVEIEVAHDVRWSKRGTLSIETAMWPILEVQDFQYGIQGALQSADLTAVLVEPKSFTLRRGGALNFGGTVLDFSGVGAAPGIPLDARWTYVAGYPVTTLAAPAVAGAGTITVASGLGIYGGPANPSPTTVLPVSTQLSIFDDANGASEVVTVASVAGNVLALNAPLAFAHAVGVSVNSLPQAVREAAVLVTTALLKTRGNAALNMAQASTQKPTGSQKSSSVGDADLDMAMAMLQPFRAR